MKKVFISFIAVLATLSLPYWLGLFYELLGAKQLTDEPTYIIGLGGTILIVIALIVLAIGTSIMYSILYNKEH